MVNVATVEPSSTMTESTFADRPWRRLVKTPNTLTSERSATHVTLVRVHATLVVTHAPENSRMASSLTSG